MYIHDTIAAISTPIGEGGISIIRVSGPIARDIGLKLFSFVNGTDFHSHFFHYGNIVNPLNAEIIDEVLTVFMKAPRSYTCEDLLEIHCHGGLFVTERILTEVLSNGARLAEPGEFTKRAFLNGRIDLLKAEAVMDVIASRSQASLLLARHQQEGELSKRIAEIKSFLINALALLEAYIDFPEDDLGTADMSRIMGSINSALNHISSLLDGYDEGRIIRDGIKVLIVGKPNVGKSSLLNCLLGEERAIVTHIAGTTRDIIEETTSIDGLAVRLLDTAGIRETDELVEKFGIKRTLDSVSLADIVLLVLDGSRPFSSEDELVYDAVSIKPVLLVQNKSDLPVKLCLPKSMSTLPLYCISTVTGFNISELKQALRKTFVSDSIMDNRQFVALSKSRHRDALQSANKYLLDLVSGINSHRELETLAIDIREALHAIGLVTGETTNDELLEQIFSSFCIGK